MSDNYVSTEKSLKRWLKSRVKITLATVVGFLIAGTVVMGAEESENVVKFNLGAEVTNENGFFYNGGFTYEFGSNDTEAYGVNIGAGYKF